ncbi:DUF2878 domain-containing protein [Psychromonas sp. B3M02]|uniref:DUF2878 domain-containing protein n=1 Tax=Psychromonas sp. B3M02 TaxID=2267226 RepID=UPI000DEB471E|nr:DUF2878 domain-containing protein [Psychromonas sp. B3M02]RBW47360.1 DUF2878 domain-containing protein [Psychromonas sp. B3M02]
MIINMLGFNLAWFGLVYFGNIFIPVALVMLLHHFILQSKLTNEVRLVLLVTVIGASVDSFLHFIHFFDFPDSALIPFWLIVLWACFASTLCHSLSFLNKSKVSQVLVGGGFAPLSYLAGTNFNAVEFSYSWTVSYLTLAVIWGSLFLLFYYLKSIILNKEIQYA